MKRHCVRITGGFNHASPFHVGDWARLRNDSPVHAGKLAVVVAEPRFAPVERVYVRIEGFNNPRQVPVGYLVKLKTPGGVTSAGEGD